MRPWSARGTATLAGADVRLRTYVQRIWQPSGVIDSPVSVTLGPAPSGHVVVEEYAVLPDPSTVRFLVPMGSRPTTVAAFHTYNATRAPVSRVMRGTLARSYAVGLADRVFPHRLVVSVDRRFPKDQWGEVLVLRHLADVLGQPELRAFAAVRRINPNVKPTLELFDGSGVPVGFAKLGTTAGTRHLVRTEAAALAALRGRLESVIVPDLLDAGDWGEVAYAVSRPLPPDLRRWTRGPYAAMQAMSTVARSGVVSRGPLANSTYAARLHADIEGVGGCDEVVQVLGHWLTRLEREASPIEFGRMHGDWIPDNLGRSGSQLVAWDWEHSTDDAPVGFDLLHWHFHLAFVKRGMRAAVGEMEAATPQLGLLDVPAESRRLIASLYLLDVFVRRMKLAHGGGGWNKRWYPGLLEVASTRDVE